MLANYFQSGSWPVACHKTPVPGTQLEITRSRDFFKFQGYSNSRRHHAFIFFFDGRVLKYSSSKESKNMP